MRSGDRRSTSNGNSTGSSYARRRRKLWLLSPDAGFGGDGKWVRCHLRCSPKCLVWVTFATLWVDRIKPGCEGGTYARGNIQPSCGWCNMAHGSRLGLARRRAKKNTPKRRRKAA